MLDRVFKISPRNLTAFCVTMQELNRDENGVKFPVPCRSLNEVTGHKLPNCLFRMVTEVFFSFSLPVFLSLSLFSHLFTFIFLFSPRSLSRLRQTIIFVVPLFDDHHDLEHPFYYIENHGFSKTINLPKK